jgi:primosomal protein N' (replication factor Y)
MSKIARVVLESPLPSLDKVFDYEIPEHLVSKMRPGQRVRVPFGRSKKAIDAYVVEIAESSEFVGKLSPIAELVSEVVSMPENMYRLFRSIADRQASTLADVMSSAIVARTVRVEKAFIERAAALQGRKKPA